MCHTWPHAVEFPIRIMRGAFTTIWDVAQAKKVSLRTATFIVACQRILRARDLRGLPTHPARP